jgi:hypothetical protein
MTAQYLQHIRIKDHVHEVLDLSKTNYIRALEQALQRCLQPLLHHRLRLYDAEKHMDDRDGMKFHFQISSLGARRRPRIARPRTKIRDRSSGGSYCYRCSHMMSPQLAREPHGHDLDSMIPLQ